MTTFDEIKQVLKQEFRPYSLQFADDKKTAAIAFLLENEIEEPDFQMPFSINIVLYPDSHVLKIYTDVFARELVATERFLTQTHLMMNEVDLIRFLYDPNIKNIYVSTEIYFKNSSISKEQLLFYIYNIQDFLQSFQTELKPFFKPI